MTLAEEQPRRGRSLLGLVGHPERFLNPVLLVLLVCQLVQATLAGILAERLFGTIGHRHRDVLQRRDRVRVRRGGPEDVGAPASRAVGAARRPTGLGARRASAPIRMRVARPHRPHERDPAGQGPEEGAVRLRGGAARVGRRRGRGGRASRHAERELIESIIEFGDTVVREVMVPAARHGHACPSDFRASEAHGGRASSTGSAGCRWSARQCDDVNGRAYAKDLMRAEREGRGREPGEDADAGGALRARDQARSPSCMPRDAGRQVPHGARRRRVRRHRRSWSRSRTCSRSWSATSSTSTTSRTPSSSDLDGGTKRVQGSLPIDELNDLLESDIPQGDWDTVGGFMLGVLGQVPRARRGRRRTTSGRSPSRRSTAAASAPCGSGKIPTGSRSTTTDES